MIIIDFNQVMISNLMIETGGSKDPLDIGLVRHMALNKLRSIRMKFRECGELVIACDSKHSWRRDQYKYYKANRKVNREASGLDWNTIFNTITMIKNEIKGNFPYKVIDIEGAEADDIIAVLAMNFDDGFPTIILSGDKDFIQLHRDGVSQYDPVQKKAVKTTETPTTYLEEHIIKGDKGDGVPNILSSDDTFISGGRQKTMTQKRLDELRIKFVTGQTKDLDKETVANYNRNKKMIDLKEIPQDLVQKIKDEFESQKPHGRDKLFPYFLAYRLKNLSDSIGDF